MKTIARIIGVLIMLAIVAGCGKPATKSPQQLANEYTAKAQEYETNGDLVEALKQYKLALTVDPQNQLAEEKSATIEQNLHRMAEERYQTGKAFYTNGQYGEARKEFLTALRYYPEHPEAKKMLAVQKELEQVNTYILHTLQPEESISTLAQQYYGDYRKFHLIAQYNELEDATRVTVGQEIKIPVLEGMPIIAEPSEIRTDSGQAPQAMSGEIIMVKGYITHIVQPEESLSKLAQTYYGDYNKFDLIAKFNNIDDITSVRVGQEIKIPEVEGVPFLTKTQDEKIKEYKVPKEFSVVKEMPEKEKAAEPKIEKEKLTVDDQAANYRELGIELFDDKKYADAIIEFQKVLNVTPGDKAAINYLSLAHFEQGVRSFEKDEYARAIKEFETSREYNKDCEKCEAYIKQSQDTFKEVHYRNGFALYKEEKLAEAIHEWELVYNMDPDYKDVDKNLKKARKLHERLEAIKRSKAKDNKQ
jgi:tetratricopeptide (TPR) repeat protein